MLTPAGAGGIEHLLHFASWRLDQHESECAEVLAAQGDPCFAPLLLRWLQFENRHSQKADSLLVYIQTEAVR